MDGQTSFEEVFNPEEYDKFKYAIHAHLQTQYPFVPVTAIGYYLFMYSVVVLVDMCGISPKFLGDMLYKIYNAQKEAGLDQEEKAILH